MFLLLQPKPKGVLPPDFLKPKRADDESDNRLKTHGKVLSNRTNTPAKKSTMRSTPSTAKGSKVKTSASKLSWDLLSSSDEESDDDMLTQISRKESNPKPPGPIFWDQIPLSGGAKDAKSERRRRYREACERLKLWFEAVESLDLPPNPLDR